MQWLDITSREEFKPIRTKPGHRTPPGILLVTYTPPDPEMAYAIQQELGGDGRVLRAVRSVGKCGPLYYYAVDLRFLHHDGIPRAWPQPGTEAWPDLYMKYTQQPQGWLGELLGRSQALGKIPEETHQIAHWQTVNPDQDAQAAIEDLNARAIKWANRNGLVIDGLLEDEGGAA